MIPRYTLLGRDPRDGPAPRRRAARARSSPAVARRSARRQRSRAAVRLFHDSDEANLRRNPIGPVPRRPALCRRLAIMSATNIRRRARGRRAGAGGLAAIEPRPLNATDRLAYDVFKYQREVDGRRPPDCWR